MAVSSVVIWRPKDGKRKEFLARLAEIKKIHERVGARVRVRLTAVGGQPGTVVYIADHDDWEKFGQFRHSLDSDAEWQKFLASAQANPLAEMVQTSVLVDAPGS